MYPQSQKICTVSIEEKIEIQSQIPKITAARNKQKNQLKLQSKNTFTALQNPLWQTITKKFNQNQDEPKLFSQRLKLLSIKSFTVTQKKYNQQLIRFPTNKLY
eukprot:TRINITY_DN10952_c1_g4_i1.p3 TRINITY_DN10952_c1_g4~~TRINITY_DN10952_c1_g4_i1.p3  ORF type:complete len:103 (+),score=4.78 TRINITY_DN10952_c1_g4_i1:220-528(+)